MIVKWLELKNKRDKNLFLDISLDLMKLRTDLVLEHKQIVVFFRMHKNSVSNRHHHWTSIDEKNTQNNFVNDRLFIK